MLTLFGTKPGLLRCDLKSDQRRHVLLIAAILVLAAVLRLFWIQYGVYEWDDERMWSLATNAIATHSLPVTGVQSTIGAPNGPLQVDFLIPFAIFTTAPVWAMVGFAVLNAAAVYLLYDFVASFCSRRAALIAALLFAVSSWALLYSRHLSQQGMMLPFQVLLFWSAARWLQKGRGLDLVLMFLWAAVMPQIYIDGLIHVGTLALILALGWQRLRPIPLLVGVSIAAGVFLPYAVNGLLPGLAFFHDYATASPRTDLSSVVYAVGQALHIGLQLLASNMAQIWDSLSGIELAFVGLEAAVYVLGIGYGLWRLADAIRWRKPAHTQMYGLLAIWLFLPIGVYLRHQDIVGWRHLMLTLPLPAIFSGLLLDRLWSWAGAVVTAALAGNSVALAGVFIAVAPTCGANSGYGLPYQYTFDIAHSIRGLAAAQGTENVYLDGYPAVTPTLQSILRRDGLNAFWSDPAHGPELDIPRDPGAAVYVTLSDDMDNARLFQEALASQQVSSQNLSCVGMVLRTYAVRPDQLRAALASQPAADLGLRGANGLAISSAILDRRLDPGQAAHIAVSWQWPGGVRPDSDYWLFAHVLDGGGRVIGQQDAPLRATAGWLQGESVVSWLDVPIPPDAQPGRYILELGMYDSHGERTDLFDAEGKRTGSSVIVQPLIIAPPAAAPANQLVPAGADFGGQIELTGFGASSDGVIELRWRALRPPDRDYTVFVHALDASGKLVGQADGEPAGGTFPTGVWKAGETILDTHRLSLPPGQYRIEVGLYYQPTLERLSGEPFSYALTIN